MSIKNILLSIIFLFFAVYNFVYTPISYFSYPLGIAFLVASTGVFVKKRKK